MHMHTHAHTHTAATTVATTCCSGSSNDTDTDTDPLLGLWIALLAIMLLVVAVAAAFCVLHVRRRRGLRNPIFAGARAGEQRDDLDVDNAAMHVNTMHVNTMYEAAGGHALSYGLHVEEDPINDPFHLDQRFCKNQKRDFAAAMDEIESGKQSFVCPAVC